MRSAFALRINSGRIIYIRAASGSLRAARRCIFTGGVRHAAVSLYSSSRENGVQKRPQAFLNPEI